MSSPRPRPPPSTAIRTRRQQPPPSWARQTRRHPRTDSDMTESVPRIITGDTVGPVDAALVPRYAGEATFARLPRIDEVAPAYDHAQITGIAAAHAGYELLSALAARKA